MLLSSCLSLYSCSCACSCSCSCTCLCRMFVIVLVFALVLMRLLVLVFFSVYLCAPCVLSGIGIGIGRRRPHGRPGGPTLSAWPLRTAWSTTPAQARVSPLQAGGPTGEPPPNSPIGRQERPEARKRPPARRHPHQHPRRPRGPRRPGGSEQARPPERGAAPTPPDPPGPPPMGAPPRATPKMPRGHRGASLGEEVQNEDVSG